MFLLIVLGCYGNMKAEMVSDDEECNIGLNGYVRERQISLG